MIMKSSSILVAVGIFASSCAPIQQVIVTDIEIEEFGIFDYRSVRTELDETSSVGSKLGMAKGLHVLSETNRIPIRPGLAYGVRFVVHGEPQNATIDIKVILRSTNACTLRAARSVVYQNDSVLKVRIGESRHIGGRFPMSEEESDCIGAPQPGTNTLELYYGDRKLAHKEFQIVKE